MSESASGKASDGYSFSRKELTCEYCGRTLSDQSGLQRHKRLKHEDELDHECPSCDSVFPTEHGLKAHHKRTHGESLAIKTATCKQCGDEFEYKNREKEPHTCGIECRDKWQTGDNAANWRGGKVENECEWCGETYKVNPNKADSQQFCGDGCRAEWHSRKFSGENNPQWNGGKLHYYGPNWKRQRRKARERDNHTCQDCGTHTSELEKAIPVHHITPRRDFIENGDLDYEAANDLNNLITLCPPCHRKWEGLYLRPDNR